MSWHETTVGEIITTKKGFAFKSSKYVNKGVPIVRVSDYTMNSISDVDLKYYPYEEKRIILILNCMKKMLLCKQLARGKIILHLLLEKWFAYHITLMAHY